MSDTTITVEKKLRKSDKARALGAKMLVEREVDVQAENVVVTHALLCDMRDAVMVECDLSKQLAMVYVKNNMSQIVKMAKELKAAKED